MSSTRGAPKARHPGRWSRLFGLALLSVATFFAVRALAPQTLGETARRTLVSQLQDHYSEYSVSIRRGTFDPNFGLVFEDIRIADHLSPLAPVEMVRIERMTVIADIHPEMLLDRATPLKTRRVQLDGVHANGWLDENGKLSLSKLLPLPKLGPAAPRMDLKRVKLRLIDHASRRRPVSAEFDEITLIDKPNAQGTSEQQLTVRGTTDFADSVVARININRDNTSVQCAIKGAHLNRDLFDRLPDQWSQPARHARDLQCVCDATLAVDRAADGGLNYQLRTTVHDGGFAHPSLPKTLSQLRGIVSCDPQGVTIESSQAMLGDAVVRLKGRINGHRWPSDAQLTLTTRGLLLDDQLAAALPPNLQKSWNRLRPHGRIDIDARLTHHNQRWSTDATVACKGVDIRYEKFPYPVESLVGTVVVRGGIAASESLNGRIGDNRMQCAFQLPIQPGITNRKTFVVATDGPVPIDKTLLNSLSPQGGSMTALESFVRSLRPRGSVQLASAVLQTDASGKQSRKIDLRVINGHLRYEKFAYPLSNVEGRVLIEDRLVTLAGFRGTNANAGSILCRGTYRIPDKIRLVSASTTGKRSPSTDSRLDLHFHATNVRMDESLRSSLPIDSQHAWDAISPSGVLDELTVAIGQQGSKTPLSINLTAIQHDSQQVTSRSLSLRPTSLPYRIDVTGGRVHFDGSRVTIESIEGKHDASKLSADGHCVRDQAGRWRLLLNIHTGSRLHPDAELIAALPSQMRAAMRALQLRGPVSIRGLTELAMPDATHPDPAIQWDLGLQLEGNRIADVGPVHALRGELSVSGISDELGIRALGQVQIDSMHIYDLQITNIRGPFSIDGDRLDLGGKSSQHQIQSAVQQQPDVSSPSIQGSMFGGTIDLDGEVILSTGRFDVQLAVNQGQVPTLLADFGHHDNEMTGLFSGRAQLQGILGTTDLMKGTGAASLSGANLYKLPLIVQVLSLLSVTPTEDVAFTDGEVEFAIFGETLTFSDMQIWGDLVALHGGGTLDHRRELDLTFNTRVSPQNTFTRILRPLRSQRYTLWTIDVRGPLHSLEIERRALEGVGQTLERLFPGMTGNQTAIESDPSEKSARSWMPWFR